MTRRFTFVPGSALIAIAYVACIVAPSSAPAQQIKKAQQYTAQQLQQITPTSPNPYLAFLPQGVEPDWDYWRSFMKIKAEERAETMTLPRSVRTVGVAESEPNDAQETADFVAGFGTGAGDDPVATFSGSIAVPPPPNMQASPPEDNGSIPLAGTVNFSGGTGTSFSSFIGDGPFAGTTGDIDFYELQGLASGQLITADIDTPQNGTLDSYLAIWNSSGELLSVNDDEDYPLNLDSLLELNVPADGDYYVSVGSFESPIPVDPFDSSSGLGVGSLGNYTLLVEIDGGGRDFDHFSFDVEAGDIIGATVSGTADRVDLYSPSGELVIGSAQDISGVYPAPSPLPGGANAVLSHVAAESGRYVIRAWSLGSGAYTGQIQVFRPRLETAMSGTARQILFIDFDGATIDTGIWGVGSPQPRILSPLSSFLTLWGLAPGDENAVIDAILAQVEQKLRTELRYPGGNNPGFDIEIRNSRDHADPFGQPNVSRVIVGGTIGESGIETIGIAQSLDVGNFAGIQSALVLLDLLSALPSDPNSLNSITLAPGSSKIDLVGVGVGNIVAHEAGHFFGCFHTENFVTAPNIMDQGGNLANTIGLGPDNTFGNANDVEVTFGEDIFTPFEGLIGTEDTLNRIAFGLTTGLDPTDIYVDFTAMTNGTGVPAFPFNRLAPALQVALFGANVKIMDGTSNETFSGGNRIDTPVVLQKPAAGSVRIGQQ